MLLYNEITTLRPGNVSCVRKFSWMIQLRRSTHTRSSAEALVVSQRAMAAAFSSHLQRRVSTRAFESLLGQVRSAPAATSAAAPRFAGLRSMKTSATASAPSAQTWTGNQSQEEFMQKDMCILVNEADEITGHASKKDCHIFNAKVSPPPPPSPLLRSARQQSEAKALGEGEH